MFFKKRRATLKLILLKILKTGNLIDKKIKIIKIQRSVKDKEIIYKEKKVRMVQ